MRKILIVGAVVLSSFAGGFVAQQFGHVGAAGNAAGYRVVNPTRIFDSRDPGGNQPKLTAGRQVTIQTGQTGSSAVGVNIALTGTDGAGFLTAWASGARPNTAIINSSQADENISNFAIIPVAADGSFQLFTLNPTHVVVDLLGAFDPLTAATTPTGTGITAVVTGYGPGGSITSVLGSATNNSPTAKSFRIDFVCPNGTTEHDNMFSLASGATKGWSVICTGVFSSGGTVSTIEI